MKKLSFIVAALAVISLSSCKKAYNCTCTDKKTSEVWAAILSGYQSDVDIENNAVADDMKVQDYTTTVTELAKTSKKAATENCPATKSTYTDYDEVRDISDVDNDNDTDEPGYSITETWTTECTLEKQ